MWRYLLSTVFIPIAAHAPLSTHPSYFEVINHKLINHLPRFVHWAYIPTSIWLGICMNMAQIIHFWIKPSNNIETNKCPPKMIYLSALGAYWNEYGDMYMMSSWQWGLLVCSVCTDTSHLSKFCRAVRVTCTQVFLQQPVLLVIRWSRGMIR